MNPTDIPTGPVYVKATKDTNGVTITQPWQVVDPATLLPAPRAGRLAGFIPGGGADGGTFRSSAVVIHLDGPHQIFRFAVNMLHQQVEFAAAAHAVLVDLRDHMGWDRFDPMARSLLGADRYDKLCDQFERDWYCVSCDKLIRVGARYAPTDSAGAACANCCRGIPEYRDRLVKRHPSTPRTPAEATP